MLMNFKAGETLGQHAAPVGLTFSIFCRFTNYVSAGSPGDLAGMVGIGATTTSDALTSFSARGPGPNNRLKPDVAAPGNQIVSCGTGTNNYATMSGTSMVCHFSHTWHELLLISYALAG